VVTLKTGSNEYKEGVTKGPHVPLAKGTVRATQALFEEITGGGGDQEYSFEVVRRADSAAGLSGHAEPSPTTLINLGRWNWGHCIVRFS